MMRWRNRSSSDTLGCERSTLMLFDMHPEYKTKENRHFYARGYYVETVDNVNEATVKKYIQIQMDDDRKTGD